MIEKLFSFVIVQNSTFVVGTEIAFLIGLLTVWYLYRIKNRKELTEDVSVF